MTKPYLKVWQPKECLSFFIDEDGLFRVHISEINVEGEISFFVKNHLDERLQIIFRDQTNQVLTHSVWFYQISDVGQRLDLLNIDTDFTGLTDSKRFYLFKMVHSNLIKWNDEIGVFKSADYPQLVHYLISTGNEHIEVLSTEPPEFTFLEKEFV